MMTKIKNKLKDSKPYLEPTQKIRKVRGRKNGFFTVDNIIVDKIARLCTPHCISVYLSLCRHADINTQNCFPSEKLIAEENKIGSTAVKNSIKKLEKLGLISVFRSRRKNGTRNVNIYTILDISQWGNKSQLDNTIDRKESQPKTFKAKNHSREVSNKETNIKETKDKDVLFKKEENPTASFKKFFSREENKPEFLK